MIRSHIVKQVEPYRTVSKELGEWLEIIQDKWHCKVISVTETKVSKSPLDKSDQGFIILYEDDDYTIGLYAAWNCAAKICEKIPYDQIDKVFNSKAWWKYTPEEAIKIVEEWESKNA